MMFHQFVSAVADGVDATVARPSNWNDEHITPNTLTADVAMPPASAGYIPGPFDLVTFVCEIGSGSVLEVG